VGASKTRGQHFGLLLQPVLKECDVGEGGDHDERRRHRRTLRMLRNRRMKRRYSRYAGLLS
jgi:hypothetical protein